MKHLFFLLLCFCTLGMQPTMAQSKFSKVKVFVPAGNTALRTEMIAQLDIDHFYYDEDGGLVGTTNESGLNYLRRSGLKFEVLVDDEVKAFQEKSKQFFDIAKREGAAAAEARMNGGVGMDASCNSLSAIIATPSLFSNNGLPQGSMGGYFTYAEMVAKIDQLVNLYGGIVQKINLGNSYEGRTIWGVKISDNVASDENEPEVLYLGLQHAREAISGTSMIFFMQYLAQNYGVDDRITNLVNNREFYIVPCVNPDGYEFNRINSPGGGGLHRKNRRNVGVDNPSNGQSKGVDLNRNYGVDWANCSGASSSCGSSSPSAETYYGASAFSEPETQAIRNLVTTHHFVASIDQHCYGPYYSLPFGRPSLHTMNSLDQKFYTHIPALMGKYNCMRAGNSPQSVNYEVAGGIKDWLLMGDIGTGTKGVVYGMTGEGGGGGFWAPSSQIISLSRGMCFQNLQLAYAAGAYFDIQDRSDIEVTASSGSFGFSLRRIGLKNAPVTVSLIPIENIMTAGAPVTVNSIPTYYDSVHRQISYTLYPSIGNGQRIRYAWKIVSDGATFYDTVTRLYKPLVLFADNMEGTFSDNWSATISPSGSSGWAYTNSIAYGGSKSMTESPAGNYTTSTTRTVQYKSTLNLTGATAAYLSFWVRHRAENCRDKLRIEVSTNGSSWTTLCGKNTIQENNNDGSTLNSLPALTGIRENWTQELVDLSGFANQSNLRLRFQFSSDADATTYYFERDDGFNIDDIKVIKTTATLLNHLPVVFESIHAQLLNNNSVQIDWEAYTDGRHDYFEVEKSADGNEFEAIGKRRGQPPYQLNDPAPFIGNNFYRVKQYDVDGAVTYSKVVNVVNAPKMKLAIYPNPVRDQLRIRLEEQRSMELRIIVLDAQGKLRYDSQVKKLGASGELLINTREWVPQVYILKVQNASGELITLQKFIKQ